jgi:hypothetical protein
MAVGGEQEGREMSEGADAGVVLPPRPQTARDLAAAKLAGTLKSRPGHVIVVGETADDARDLFSSIEQRLGRGLRLTVAGNDIDPEAVVRALWEADGRTTASAGRPLGMMRVLAGEAALAGRPIIVAVTDTDAAEAGTLERLRQMIESVPAAEEVVRIVLLGGPGLLDVLAKAEARAVSMRVVATIRVPASSAAAAAATMPLTAPPMAVSRATRATPMRYLAPLVAIVLAVVWLRSSGEDSSVTRETPATPEAAAPSVAPAVTEAPVIADVPAVASAPVAPEVEPTPMPEPAAPSVLPAPIAATPPAAAPAAPVPPPTLDAAPAAKPAATTPRPAAPATAPCSGLALQVGAFSTEANAAELRRRLGDRFGATRVASVERDGRRYFRVRVEGFAREADRRAAAEALRAAGFSPVPVRD